MARITQGIFSLLPDLTDSQIKKQIEYAIKKAMPFLLSIQMILILVTVIGKCGVFLFLIFLTHLLFFMS